MASCRYDRSADRCSRAGNAVGWKLPNRRTAGNRHIGNIFRCRVADSTPPVAAEAGPSDGSSSTAPALHPQQYAPGKRVSRKPKRLRRSLITVSCIIEWPHRSHSIAGLPRRSSQVTYNCAGNTSRTIVHPFRQNPRSGNVPLVRYPSPCSARQSASSGCPRRDKPN